MFYRVLLGLLRFTGSFQALLTTYRNLPGFIGFDQIESSLTGFYWVLLGFTRFYWVSLGFSRFYSLDTELTGFDWVWLGFIGFFWIFTEFKKDESRLTGFYLAQTWPLRKRWWHFLVTKDPFSFFFSGRCLREEQRVFLSFFFRFTIAILPFSSKKKKRKKMFQKLRVRISAARCRARDRRLQIVEFQGSPLEEKEGHGRPTKRLPSFFFIYTYLYIYSGDIPRVSSCCSGRWHTGWAFSLTLNHFIEAGAFLEGRGS